MTGLLRTAMLCSSRVLSSSLSVHRAENCFRGCSFLGKEGQKWQAEEPFQQVIELVWVCFLRISLNYCGHMCKLPNLLKTVLQRDLLSMDHPPRFLPVDHPNIGWRQGDTRILRPFCASWYQIDIVLFQQSLVCWSALKAVFFTVSIL